MGRVIKDKTVAGLMAISDFAMAPEMAADLAMYCDVMVLRFDTINGDKALYKECLRRVPSDVKVIGIRGREAWNRWNWREQLIRALDPVKPDVVLFLDSDEKYDRETFPEDLVRFLHSGRDIMMFDYAMATDDGRKVKKYPGARHCKAYRWAKGIGYRPYKGYARPTWPSKNCMAYNADSRIHHFCFYTQAMEAEKQNNLHK